MKLTRLNIAISLFCFSLSGIGHAAFAAESGGDGATAKAAPTPAAAASEEHVKSSASQEIGKRRMSLDNQAIAANDEIFHAIMFLNKKDAKGAFKMLEKADGQLNVVLARDPHLKLAAIDVRASVNDLEGSTNTIQKAVKESESDLDKGQIQAARAMLAPLVSEMHIDTDYLPLEVYPDVIKRASKEIQASKLKEAEATLDDALGSIVTVEDVIPLPPMKAEGDVLDAERLLKADKIKNKDKVLALLSSADNHLSNADALGYGKYQNIRDEIASIKLKVEGGKAKPDLFERVKALFHEITHGKA